MRTVKVKTQCPTCKNVFFTHPYRFRNAKNVLCSRECSARSYEKPDEYKRLKRQAMPYEPKMPDPRKANQKPEVDMSNEIKKGGDVPEKKDPCAFCGQEISNHTFFS